MGVRVSEDELREEIDRLRASIEACSGSCKARLTLDALYDESDLLRDFPITEMIEREWLLIGNVESIVEVEAGLRLFFGVGPTATTEEIMERRGT